MPAEAPPLVDGSGFVANRFHMPRTDEDGSYTEEGARRELDRLSITVSNPDKILIGRKWKPGPRYPTTPEGVGYFFARRVPVLNPPKGHDAHFGDYEDEFDESKKSDARYGVDEYRYKAEDGKENIMYDSYIEPFGTTSYPFHVHGHGVYEHYLLREGGVAFLFNGRQIRKMRTYEKIPPFTPHFIFTEESPAELRILVENVKGIPSDKIHLPFTGNIPDLGRLGRAA